MSLAHESDFSGTRYSEKKPLFPEELSAFNLLFTPLSPLNIARCGSPAGKQQDSVAMFYLSQRLFSSCSTFSTHGVVQSSSQVDDLWVFDAGNEVHCPAAVVRDCEIFSRSDRCG